MKDKVGWFVKRKGYNPENTCFNRKLFLDFNVVWILRPVSFLILSESIPCLTSTGNTSFIKNGWWGSRNRKKPFFPNCNYESIRKNQALWLNDCWNRGLDAAGCRSERPHDTYNSLLRVGSLNPERICNMPDLKNYLCSALILCQEKLVDFLRGSVFPSP